jgi:sugar/nucleoside kinase (ribokinase family)
MQLEYPTTNPDIRTLTVAGTAGKITPGQVNGLEMKAAVIGTSLRGEVGLDVIRELRKKQILLAADVQGFVRVLRGLNLKYEPWEEMQKTLACVDILKSDAVEAEFLTGEKDVKKAALAFAAMGPREIVLTHKDGVLVHTEKESHDIGFFPENLSGRSGRGDTCLGSYVAMRLSKPPYESGIWSAAVTSLKMEKLGVFDRPVSDVEKFIQAHYSRDGRSGG